MKIITSKKEFNAAIKALQLHSKFSYIEADCQFEPFTYNGFVFLQRYYSGYFCPYLVAYTLEAYKDYAQGYDAPRCVFTKKFKFNK